MIFMSYKTKCDEDELLQIFVYLLMKMDTYFVHDIILYNVIDHTVLDNLPLISFSSPRLLEEKILDIISNTDKDLNNKKNKIVYTKVQNRFHIYEYILKYKICIKCMNYIKSLLKYHSYVITQSKNCILKKISKFCTHNFVCFKQNYSTYIELNKKYIDDLSHTYSSTFTKITTI